MADSANGDGAKPTGGIETAIVVEILPTRIWIENGMTGERVVVAQHEGCEPFDVAKFGYDHRYTDNNTTWNAAKNFALSLGATDPIEVKMRHWHMPTAEEIREQIRKLEVALAALEGQGKPTNGH